MEFQTKLKPVEIQDTRKTLERAPGSHSCPQLPQMTTRNVNFPAGFKRSTSRPVQYNLKTTSSNPRSFHLCLAAPDRIESMPNEEPAPISWMRYHQKIPKPQSRIKNQIIRLGIEKSEEKESFPTRDLPAAIQRSWRRRRKPRRSQSIEQQSFPESIIQEARDDLELNGPVFDHPLPRMKVLKDKGSRIRKPKSEEVKHLLEKLKQQRSTSIEEEVNTPPTVISIRVLFESQDQLITLETRNTRIEIVREIIRKQFKIPSDVWWELYLNRLHLTDELWRRVSSTWSGLEQPAFTLQVFRHSMRDNVPVQSRPKTIKLLPHVQQQLDECIQIGKGKRK